MPSLYNYTAGQYVSLALFFVDKENHIVSSEYDSSLAVKIFIFQFCNSYVGIFYSLFVEADIATAAVSITTLMATKEIVSIAQAIYPLMQMRGTKKALAKSFEQAQGSSEPQKADEKSAAFAARRVEVCADLGDEVDCDFKKEEWKYSCNSHVVPLPPNYVPDASLGSRLLAASGHGRKVDKEELARYRIAAEVSKQKLSVPQDVFVVLLQQYEMEKTKENDHITRYGELVIQFGYVAMCVCPQRPKPCSVHSG